jgi:hypothetical protein
MPAIMDELLMPNTNEICPIIQALTRHIYITDKRHSKNHCFVARRAEKVYWSKT